METRRYGPIIIVVVAILIIAGVWYVLAGSSGGLPGTNATSTQSGNTTGTGATSSTQVSCTGTCSNDIIVLTTPKPGDAVSSPLQVSGQARGPWYFEGSFPIQITDASGNVLSQGTAKAQGEWTTSNFVPFTASLGFDSSAVVGNKLFLILRRDNPSGLPQNEGTLTVPLTLGAQ